MPLRHSCTNTRSLANPSGKTGKTAQAKENLTCLVDGPLAVDSAAEAAVPESSWESEFRRGYGGPGWSDAWGPAFAKLHAKTLVQKLPVNSPQCMLRLLHLADPVPRGSEERLKLVEVPDTSAPLGR